jgi:dTDP-D-glucose 4,6-dehydratase
MWRRLTSNRELCGLAAFVGNSLVRIAVDASKLERELGWRAKESFESGLE